MYNVKINVVKHSWVTHHSYVRHITYFLELCFRHLSDVSSVFNVWYAYPLTKCWYALFQLSSPGIQCQLCHMVFIDQSAISAHYNTAHARSHPDAKHECDVCGKKFTSRGNLKMHLKTIHRVGDVMTFPCPSCSHVFKRKHHLQRHLKTVHRCQDFEQIAQ